MFSFMGRVNKGNSFGTVMEKLYGGDEWVILAEGGLKSRPGLRASHFDNTFHPLHVPKMIFHLFVFSLVSPSRVL